MKIKGTISGQIDKIALKLNQQSDGQTAVIDLVTRVNEERCRELFGDDFARVAFGGMVQRQTVDADGNPDGGTEYAHLIKNPKPSGELVLEMHEVQIFGRKLKGKQPELSVNPVDGEQLADV